MANSKKIHVMISSRCRDEIEFQGQKKTLSDVRCKLKEELEAIKLFNNQLFEIWINEDAPPDEGSQDSWDHCMNQIQQADIVLVLYNGNSGWAKEDGDIGICHAELQTALSIAPAKVRLIEITSTKTSNKHERDERFKKYIDKQNLFRGQTANNGEQIIERCKEALQDAIPKMVRLGVREARKGKFCTGEALDWSKLDFSKRKKMIEQTLYKSLKSREGALEKENIGVFIPIKEKEKLVFFQCHGIPDSMAVAAAREMIGQPFIHDYINSSLVGDNYIGPVHFIACYGKVTEAQVRKLMGSPDIILILQPFGIYAADRIHKSQLILISDCRDDSSTRNGIQRFFDWLEQSEEDKFLIQRAKERSQIVQVIANVNKYKRID
ncbi:MAG: DUF4062 domain-containing protein [Hydrococcus sp. CRU_1_1]|nr:DUF4062 domain-containing protein [Hydrococcus sp. CRU_1_1]NJQ96809.1 DUF4062 domain-containing protein [Hydrococcus sp. CSU_1_8]